MLRENGFAGARGEAEYQVDRAYYLTHKERNCLVKAEEEAFILEMNNRRESSLLKFTCFYAINEFEIRSLPGRRA